MNSTIAGFFDSSRAATRAADALVAAGYHRDQISVLASETEHKRNAGITDVVEIDEKRGERAGKGAMLGGFAGLVVGLAAIFIPGVGPFLVLGPAATALTSAAVGATAGGLLGGLTKLGIPHDHAEFFVEGMRQGGTLLLLSAPASEEANVLAILRKHGAVDVGERIKAGRTAVAQPVATTPVATTPVITPVAPVTTARTAPAIPVAKAPVAARPVAERKLTGLEDTLPGTTKQVVIPIAEERLEVGKQQIAKGGVRVETKVLEKPVQEQVSLRDEHVDVERRAVDRPATTADMTAGEGSIEVREREEKALIEKKARVVEEVIVTKDATTRTETVSDTVRKEEVNVKPLPARESGRTVKIPPPRSSHPLWPRARGLFSPGASGETMPVMIPRLRAHRSLLSSALFALFALGSPEASAKTVLLRHDMLETSGKIAAQCGFAVGEAFGARFTPPSYPAKLSSVLVFVSAHTLGASCGEGSPDHVATWPLAVYRLEAGVEAPGAKLLEAQAGLPTNDTLSLLSLEPTVSIDQGDFFVSFTIDDTIASPATEADGQADAASNFIYGDIGSGKRWYTFADLGKAAPSGNWIVRLCVEVDGEGPTPDECMLPAAGGAGGAAGQAGASGQGGAGASGQGGASQGGAGGSGQAAGQGGSGEAGTSQAAGQGGAGQAGAGQGGASGQGGSSGNQAGSSGQASGASGSGGQGGAGQAAAPAGDEGDGGGCGCRVVPGGSSAAGWAWAMLLAAGAALGRRRRRASPPC